MSPSKPIRLVCPNCRHHVATISEQNILQGSLEVVCQDCGRKLKVSAQQYKAARASKGETLISPPPVQDATKSQHTKIPGAASDTGGRRFGRKSEVSPEIRRQMNVDEPNRSATGSLSDAREGQDIDSAELQSLLAEEFAAAGVDSQHNLRPRKTFSWLSSSHVVATLILVVAAILLAGLCTTFAIQLFYGGALLTEKTSHLGNQIESLDDLVLPEETNQTETADLGPPINLDWTKDSYSNRSGTARGSRGGDGRRRPSVGDLAGQSHIWSDQQWAHLVVKGQRPSLDGRSHPGTVINQSKTGWPLILPAGQHLLQQNNESLVKTVELSQDFRTFYDGQLARYQVNNKYDYDSLLKDTVETAGAFHDPILPHVWGNYFWQEKHSDAAVRYWKRAARIEPTFAPAHLNLAYAANISGNTQLAIHEIAVATSLNFQNAYGLKDHILQLHLQLPAKIKFEPNARYDVVDYEDSKESLSQHERRVVNTLIALGDYVNTDFSRETALNNVGVYLLLEANKPGQAHFYVQKALDQLLALDAIQHQRVLVKTLLANLTQAAQRLDMAEAELYEQLQESYQ